MDILYQLNSIKGLKAEATWIHFPHKEKNLTIMSNNTLSAELLNSELKLAEIVSSKPALYLKLIMYCFYFVGLL